MGALSLKYFYGGSPLSVIACVLILLKTFWAQTKAARGESRVGQGAMAASDNFVPILPGAPDQGDEHPGVHGRAFSKAKVQVQALDEKLFRHPDDKQAVRVVATPSRGRARSGDSKDTENSQRDLLRPQSSGREFAEAARAQPLSPVRAKSPADSLPSNTSSEPVSPRVRILEILEEPPLGEEQRRPSKLRRQATIVVAVSQKYSVPLVLGVIAALMWANIDMTSYHMFFDSPIFEGAELLGHKITLHFLVNDIFMCFFFGLAIKEVTEALLPGGSLSPLSKAVNPLMATIGGIAFPIAVYLIAVLTLDGMGAFEKTDCAGGAAEAAGGHRLLAAAATSASGSAFEKCELGMLLHGWGIPTATDISLAWMGAVVLFGRGHPVINFLLLLAIVDDAIGILIIAAAYPDPHHPVEPVYFLLVFGAMALMFLFRYAGLRRWSVYIVVGGFISWLGLILAHVHPALALVFIVPFLPAGHLDHPLDDEGDEPRPAWKIILGPKEEHSPPLHDFEHRLKMPVDCGMFLFGFANAGVALGTVGGITASVLIALILGKMIGITLMSLLASKMGFGLPEGVNTADLIVCSVLAGIGLTVALFVSGEAFVVPGLQGQAKMGAVLSVVCGLIAWVLRKACVCSCLTGQGLDDGPEEIAIQEAGPMRQFVAAVVPAQAPPRVVHHDMRMDDVEDFA